jgi:hypothetical protein
MSSFAEKLEDRLGATVASIADLRAVADVLQHLADRPAITWQRSLFEPALIQNHEQVERLAELERERSELTEELLETYERSFLSVDGSELNSELAKYGILRFFRPSYRSTKRRVMNHTLESYDPSFSQLVDDTRKLAELQQLEDRREEHQGIIQALDILYQAEDTDWELLFDALSWTAELTEYDDEVTTPIIDALVEADVPDAESLSQRANGLIERYEDAASFFEESMATEEIVVEQASRTAASFESHREYIDRLQKHVPELQRWVEFTKQLEAVRETPAKDFIDAFLETDHSANELLPTFKLAYYTDWVNAVYEEAGLAELSTNQLEQYLDEFRRIDREQQEIAKLEIQHQVTSRRPSLNLQHASSSDQVIVRREAEKERRHRPLRELFDEAGSVVTQLTP